MKNKITVFALSASEELAKDIAKELGTNVGKSKVHHFADGEILVEMYSYYLNIPTKEAGPFMIITLIFIGCLLTCFGFFDKWVNFAKAGLIVPITGFAHSMMSAALDYRKEGLVTGLGASMLKLAGSVIIFGVVSAYVFGLIRILLFGGQV